MTSVERPPAVQPKDAPAGKALAEPEPEDMEVEAPGEAEEDLYTRLKTLQRQLEFFEIQASSFSPS